jgi:thioredoxin 1
MQACYVKCGYRERTANRGETMKVFLSLIMSLLLLSPALAAELPYRSDTLDRLLADGRPVVVDFHADWCPICRAQAPVIKNLLSKPEFKDLTVLIANYDTELPLRKSLNVSQQSTLVVFRHGKEVARSTGQTDPEKLAAFLRQALS